MKKLKIKVKYAILACTLQDDFENLMAKLSFLELFPLTPPRKSLKEDVKARISPGFPVCASALGEKVDSPRPGDNPNSARGEHTLHPSAPHAHET